MGTHSTEFKNYFTSARVLANDIREGIFRYRSAAKLNGFQHEQVETIVAARVLDCGVGPTSVRQMLKRAMF